jgi:hypothetical protein
LALHSWRHLVLCRCCRTRTWSLSPEPSDLDAETSPYTTRSLQVSARNIANCQSRVLLPQADTNDVLLLCLDRFETSFHGTETRLRCSHPGRQRRHNDPQKLARSTSRGFGQRSSKHDTNNLEDLGDSSRVTSQARLNIRMMCGNGKGSPKRRSIDSDNHHITPIAPKHMSLSS